MTIEELRQKPIGLLETRVFTINEREEKYFLVKGKEEYSIGFSSTGDYCARFCSEKTMLTYLNDKELSDGVAFEIYAMSPQLSCGFMD